MLSLFEHGLFNLVRKHGEVTGYPVEHLALGLVGGEIADQGALGGILPQLFQLSLVILHRTPRTYNVGRYEGFAGFAGKYLN